MVFYGGFMGIYGILWDGTSGDVKIAIEAMAIEMAVEFSHERL